MASVEIPTRTIKLVVCWNALYFAYNTLVALQPLHDVLEETLWHRQRIHLTLVPRATHFKYADFGLTLRHAVRQDIFERIRLHHLRLMVWGRSEIHPGLSSELDAPVKCDELSLDQTKSLGLWRVDQAPFAFWLTVSTRARLFGGRPPYPQ